MSNTYEDSEAWCNAIRDALTREGAPLAPDCPVYDSLGDMMYEAGGEYFVAITGNAPDAGQDDPIQAIVAIHIRDLMNTAMKAMTYLKDAGKLDYLQSLGIPVVDMSDEDDEATEHKLH